MSFDGMCCDMTCYDCYQVPIVKLRMRGFGMTPQEERLFLTFLDRELEHENPNTLAALQQLGVDVVHMAYKLSTVLTKSLVTDFKLSKWELMQSATSQPTLKSLNHIAHLVREARPLLVKLSLEEWQTRREAMPTLSRSRSSTVADPMPKVLGNSASEGTRSRSATQVQK